MLPQMDGVHEWVTVNPLCGTPTGPDLQIYRSILHLRPWPPALQTAPATPSNFAILQSSTLERTQHLRRWGPILVYIVLRRQGFLMTRRPDLNRRESKPSNRTMSNVHVRVI